VLGLQLRPYGIVEVFSFTNGVFMVDSKQPKALRHGNARVLT